MNLVKNPKPEVRNSRQYRSFPKRVLKLFGRRPLMVFAKTTWNRDFRVSRESHSRPGAWVDEATGWLRRLPVRNGFAFPQILSRETLATPAPQGAALQGDGQTLSGKPKAFRTGKRRSRNSIDPPGIPQLVNDAIISRLLRDNGDRVIPSCLISPTYFSENHKRPTGTRTGHYPP